MSAVQKMILLSVEKYDRLIKQQQTHEQKQKNDTGQQHKNSTQDKHIQHSPVIHESKPHIAQQHDQIAQDIVRRNTSVAGPSLIGGSAVLAEIPREQQSAPRPPGIRANVKPIKRKWICLK